MSYQKCKDLRRNIVDLIQIICRIVCFNFGIVNTSSPKCPHIENVIIWNSTTFYNIKKLCKNIEWIKNDSKCKKL